MIICEREELLLELLRSGRELAGTELGAHVAGCAPCTELMSVATALLDENHDAMSEASVPTSGVMWWKIQRRARAEALRTAARTVSTVQVASVSGAIAIALGITGIAFDWRGWIQTFVDVVTIESLHLPAAATLAQWSVPLVFAAVACLTLAPVALYLSISRD